MSEEIHRAIAEISVEKNGEKVLPILYMSAYFMPAKNIYLDMFSDQFASTEEIDAVIPLLKQKSLIEPYDNDAAFVIKKTTQSVIRGFLKQTGKEKSILRKAVALFTYQMKENEIHPNCVDHALSLLTYIREFPDLLEFSSALPNTVVLALQEQNRLEEAFEFGKNAMKFLEKALGEGHTETLSLQHSLGLVLGMEGKHAKAEKVSRELRKKDFIYSSKEEMVESLILHARELCELSKYEEALPLYQKVIGNRNVLETFEKGVLVAWNDYGTLLSDMGRHSEAVSILQDVLVQNSRVLTDDNRYGIATRRSLALAFLAQKNYNQALKHLKQSMFEGEERLGKLHPDTLRAERDIGLVLMNKCEYREALTTLENVVSKFKQVLTKNHPDILCTRANIINTLIQLKKYDQALEISEDVYEAYRNSLGEKHNETLRVKSNIGSIYLEQGRVNEAVKIFQDVYSGFLSVFGSEHYLTNQVRATLELFGGLPQETGSKSETLQEAIFKGDLQKVIYLIENNMDVNEKDFEGERPLHYASLKGHIDIAKYLLKKGAMHDAKNLKGETPLSLASGIRMKNLLISVRNLFNNVKKGNQTNIAEQAELINLKDENGYSLLHWAVNNSTKCIVQELLDAGCNLKCFSLKGNTPLHIAAGKCHIDIADILLQSVAIKDLSDFVNAKTTQKGNTALHIAAKNNNFGMVKCLLNYGAYYDIPNKDGETPVQLSSSQSIRGLLNMAGKLFSSFQEGNPNVVISEQAEIINFMDKNGYSLLHWAVNYSKKCIVQELLDAGCNLKCVTLKGNTPLHIAVAKGYIDIADILLQSVAVNDLSDFVNAKTTQKGNTALHIAAKNNNLDMVKCLLKYGAYYDIPNKDGETPVQLSSSQSMRELLNVTDNLFSSFQKENTDVSFE